MLKNLLILKTNKEKLHDEEFVKPVVNIIRNYTKNIEIKSVFDDKFSLEKYDAIIITGTSLQDMAYKKHARKWKILKDFQGTILGICAGMQILALVYDLKLQKCLSIGVHEIHINNKRKKVYDLHQYSISKSEKIEILAKHKCIEAFRVKGTKHYGFAFHPEVLNEEILKEVLLKKEIKLNNIKFIKS